jgi:hypothetical protein
MYTLMVVKVSINGDRCDILGVRLQGRYSGYIQDRCTIRIRTMGVSFICLVTNTTWDERDAKSVGWRWLWV